ncbi:indole-diterpene biosynthesis protein-like protein PaxU [Sporormia fimetaria CBS 119925]|uniref:Indole-diterpene biosynthesis protein-like protein PaxU n=1 Tax=Sporormia fimetaria CBS 119925 TaxID=1340428 RepID=A0A6A6UY26_9PLEO|nr:indole-diterpene biosynthesis protein-like protein PaxU [Sporormia fimetaria CBS 119925]
MSTSATTPTVIPNPLADFSRIGHNTYLYTPSTYTPQSPLIFLCTWMGAAPKHIAKYTVTYRRLFPSSRILLIRCELLDMFTGSVKVQRGMGPALDVVREHVGNEGRGAGGGILAHNFSNGGSTMLVSFAQLWLQKTGTTLPLRTHVIDSAPGKGGWKRSHAAIYVSLPRNIFTRLFGSIAVHFLLFLHFLFDKLTRRENRMVVLGRLLNDARLFDTKTPRVYLYSRKDLMVGDDEVEEHADQAAAMGRWVTKVRFENSAHAGHIMEDQGRYWEAVMGAWESAGGRGENGSRLVSEYVQ